MVAVLIYTHRSLRQDMGQLRRDMAQMESRLGSRMDRVETQIGDSGTAWDESKVDSTNSGISFSAPAGQRPDSQSGSSIPKRFQRSRTSS